MPVSARLLTTVGLASTFGLFYGIGKGAKLSSLRYLAENAHRLPRTKGTWYFFHKRKNYVVLRDGINYGIVTALKYGGVTALFFGIEAAVDKQREALSWVSTTTAAMSTGLIVSGFQGLPWRQLLRSVRNFTIIGALVAVVQDRVRGMSRLSRETRFAEQSAE